MAHGAPVGVRDLQFGVGTPAEVMDRFGEEVLRDFRQRYYERSTTGRTPEEIAAFVGKTTRLSWNSPKKSGLRGHHARTKVVTAVDPKGALAGYAYFGDVGSDIKIPHLPLHIPLSGRAKLWVAQERLVRSRYHQEREVVDDGSERPGLRQSLTAVGLAGRDPRQGFSRWLFDEEEDLREESRDYDLVEVPITREEVHPFGDDAPATHMTMYKGSAEHVLAHVRGMSPRDADLHDAVNYALNSAGMFTPNGV